MQDAGWRAKKNYEGKNIGGRTERPPYQTKEENKIITENTQEIHT
jgi:hypothetical protein